MDGRDFRNFMETFLRYADNGSGKAFNYAWSGGMSIASIVALVLLGDDPGSTSFVLTAIGLGVVIVGILIVSNVWKTALQRDPGVGPRGDASGLGGGTAALLHRDRRRLHAQHRLGVDLALVLEPGLHRPA
jgi:hypothetical protein